MKENISHLVFPIRFSSVNDFKTISKNLDAIPYELIVSKKLHFLNSLWNEMTFKKDCTFSFCFFNNFRGIHKIFESVIWTL